MGYYIILLYCSTGGWILSSAHCGQREMHSYQSPSIVTRISYSFDFNWITHLNLTWCITTGRLQFNGRFLVQVGSSVFTATGRGSASGWVQHRFTEFGTRRLARTRNQCQSTASGGRLPNQHDQLHSGLELRFGHWYRLQRTGYTSIHLSIVGFRFVCWFFLDKKD